MANEIQKSLVGSVSALAAGVIGAKEGAEKKAAAAEKAVKAQEAEKLQKDRETELHSLQVKGLKAENRTKRYQARTAKAELELVRAKARDYLESAQEQSKSKSSVKERLKTLGKEKAPNASNK